MNYRFSLIHPTIRPFAWRAVHDKWAATASWVFQYLLCIDEGSTFETSDRPDVNKIVNHGRKCNVSATNEAAIYATGDILVWVADDMFPPENWDTQILEAIAAKNLDPLKDPFVLEVSTGTPNEHERRILPIAIMSRARYEQTHRFFYPEYFGMYSDNDLFEEAVRDGVLIDCRHIHFDHRHPMREGKPMEEWDEAYRWNNRREAYETGERIFNERKRLGFPSGMKRESKLKYVHLVTPGAVFRREWCSNRDAIMAGLVAKGYAVVPHWFDCSNVFITRNVLAEMILGLDVPVDYIVWMDDDNIADVHHVLRLIDELANHPEASMIAGWTWIQSDVVPTPYPKASCGVFNERGFCEYVSGFTIEGDSELVEFEWTGFPLVVMRRETLVMAGRNPFAPVASKDQSAGFGYYGEDVSFCVKVRNTGGRIFVDPLAYVPHLKLREAVPDGVSLGGARRQKCKIS